MSKLIKPDKKWADLKTVEKWHRKEKNIDLAKKLNAVRLLMKGKTQKEVAEVIGVSVATIRNWRTNWNQKGKEGLKSDHKGFKPKITDDIRLEIEDIIEIKQEINGKTVTGKLIHGYIKKNTN